MFAFLFSGSWSASTSPVRSPSPGDRSESGRTYYGTTSLDQRSRSPSPVSTTGSGRHTHHHHHHQQPHHLHHHGGGTSVSSSNIGGPNSSLCRKQQPPVQPPSSASSTSHHPHHQQQQHQHHGQPLSAGGGHATSVSAMMIGSGTIAVTAATGTTMTMPPPSINSSYPVLAGYNRRRLPATPNKPSSLQLRAPNHSASINFPKLNASPTRGPQAALPKPPGPAGAASATAAAVARQSMAMTAMPPLSFEQAMSIGRSGRLLPSPVRNGYASSKQQQQPLSSGAATGNAVRRQKGGSGGSGTGGTGAGSGRVSSRHSDSDEDDWC